MLAALGSAAMPAIAGCTGSSDGGTGGTTDAASTPTQTHTMEQETAQQSNGQSVDQRFGYVGTNDQDPPVEPDHTVEMVIEPRDDAWLPEFYFEPVGLAIEPGDTVRFNMASPHHNINGYHPAFGYTQRVPEGVPPYSSPILTVGDYWLYTFETEGVHNIMCAPHELFGMVGAIVVGSPTGPAANPVGEAPAPTEQSRPPEFTAGLVLSDPALAPETIAEAGSVSWQDLNPESKVPRLAPIGEE